MKPSLGDPTEEKKPIAEAGPKKPIRGSRWSCKTALLGITMAALLLGGASGCLTVNVGRSGVTASEKVISTQDIPNIFIEGDKATINVTDIYSLNFNEGMRQLNKLGIKKIHLNVTSGGGSVIGMNMILDELTRFVENGGQITSHASGIIASAAVPIYLMGEKRTMSRSTWVMLHPHSVWNTDGSASSYFYYKAAPEDGTPTKETFYGKFSFYLTHDYAVFLAARTNLSYEEAFKYVSTEDSDDGQYWFSAIEALDMGFVDELV